MQRIVAFMICVLFVMMIPHGYAGKRQEDDPAKSKAEAAIATARATSGAASKDQLDAMVNAIVEYKRDASSNQVQCDRFIEQAIEVLSQSISSSVLHRKRAVAAIGAIKTMSTNGLLPKEMADSLLAMAEKLTERKASQIAGIEKYNVRVAANKIAREASDILPFSRAEQLIDEEKLDDKGKKLNRKVKELHEKIEGVKEDRRKGNPVDPEKVAEIVGEVAEVAKAVKGAADAISKPAATEAAKKAAKDAAEGFAPVGIAAATLAWDTYNLIDGWSEKSDLEKTRDSAKLLASALEVTQLLLTAAVPEKLIAVLVLRVLAELLDLGIALFDGDRTPKGNGKPPTGKDPSPGTKPTDDPKDKPGKSSSRKSDQPKQGGAAPKTQADPKQGVAGAKEDTGKPGAVQFVRNEAKDEPKRDKAQPGESAKDIQEVVLTGVGDEIKHALDDALTNNNGMFSEDKKQALQSALATVLKNNTADDKKAQSLAEKIATGVSTRLASAGNANRDMLVSQAIEEARTVLSAQAALLIDERP